MTENKDDKKENGTKFVAMVNAHTVMLSKELTDEGFGVVYAYENELGGNIALCGRPHHCPAFMIAMALEALTEQAREWKVEEHVKAHRTAIRDQRRMKRKDDN